MEKPQWNIRNVYLYLVCFATLMMIIVGSVQMITAAIDVAYPNPEPMFTDAKLRFEELKTRDPDVTLEEVEAQVEKEMARQAANDRYYRIRHLINSLAMVLVALPVYLYHWRRIQHGAAAAA